MYSHCVEEAKEVRYIDVEYSSDLEECAYLGWYTKDYDILQSYTVKIQEVSAYRTSEQRQFEQLAQAWKAATRLTSSLTKIVGNDNYQQIVGMGVCVVPLILRDLAATYAYWFPALEKITSENPVPSISNGDVRAMADSWLNWGREKGLI